MASEVEIVNHALTLLGEASILSLDDNVKPAREAKKVFPITRDALLAGYNWSFAKTRTQLSELATPPAFGFAKQFQLPVNCLRILLLNEEYFGLDLTDYRGGPTDQFVIEGRVILTDIGGPLNLRYVKQVTDTTQFHPNFTEAFGCRLAMRLAETLTQSRGKRELATADFREAISAAVRANAIELPPQKLPDDEWLTSRR